MKKRRIVLASVLKPVDDPRMFEKMATSLARSGAYEVHVIGHRSDGVAREPAVHFHTLSPFKRISPGRIRSRLKVLKIVIKVKPELLIVTTHELLGVAFLIRILFGTKIIYDLQENYWRNIMYTDAFPKGTRAIIGCLVRMKEIIISPFIAHFILAEKAYFQELGFVKNKCTIIENKCLVPQDFERKPVNDYIQLVFTGTIAESTGVFQAIDLAKALHSIEHKIRLTIIGSIAQTKVKLRIQHEVDQNSFIRLTGDGNIIPHQKIMEAIATANFGLLYYPPSPHTENKIPTKLFEYLACHWLLSFCRTTQPWMANVRTLPGRHCR